jgi:hypothetical protein
MTNLTARELMDTILRSLAETRAKLRGSTPAPADERTTLRPTQKEARSTDETADLESR